MSTLAASGFPVKPDPEVLACATILHDLGLTEKYESNDRFEVDGANAARAFLRGHGMKERDLQCLGFYRASYNALDRHAQGT
jgi:HD superfamily phosphodiesterase